MSNSLETWHKNQPAQNPVEPKVLIVTATPLETEAIHKLLRPIPPGRRLSKVSRGSQTYYLGILGKQTVVHVECKMGSVAPGASLVTVFEAINSWKIVAVIKLS